MIPLSLGYSSLAGRIALLGIERIVVKKLGENTDSAAATLVFMGFGGVMLIPLLFFTEFRYHPILWLTLLSGLVYSAGFFLYVKSLSIGEASLVSPLYNFNILFLLVFSAVILNETITIYKIAGVLLMIYGMSFLNRQRSLLLSLKAVFYDRACRLMIVCSLLVAVGRAIDGYIVHRVPPILYALAGSAAMMTYLTLYAVWARKIPSVIELIKKRPVLSVFSGTVNAYSYILLLFAFTVIPVSVAEPVSMLSMIVTVILAKYIFQERIRNRIIGAVIMLAGAWLLFV